MRDVLDAFRDEVLERGYVNVSIERVAERAGVHKTSVYRRWPTKADLLAGFMESDSLTAVPSPPDTGSLDGDSRIVLALAGVLLTNRYVAFWRAVESEGAHPVVADVKKRIWQLRVDFFGTIIERARARGEIDDSLDGALVVDLYLGAVTVRSIARGERVTQAWLERTWWQILASAGFQPPAHARRHGSRASTRKRA